MNQLFFKFSLCLVCIFTGISSAFASNLPFTDVSPTDDYYQDLLNLYERGIITDTIDHRFNPDSLMNRDDFVAIVVGVSCKHCLTPTFEDILKYTKNPFIDFERNNHNFYCVSYAEEQKIIEGYTLDASGNSMCENGQTYTQTPFCAFNKITRIEATAVLLRQAGLWNNTLNSSNFERRLSLPDTPENWYGYAQKGIEVGIITADANGKIRPNENITRREFVGMAANIFRVNLCAIRSSDGTIPLQTTNTDVPSDSVGGTTYTGVFTSTGNIIPVATVDLSSEIRILDSNMSCSKTAPITSFPDSKATQYTFCSITESTEGSYTYNWDFAQVQSGAHLTATGSDLTNFDLGTPGTWLVKLTVVDTVTNKVSVSTATIDIGKNNSTDVSSFKGLSLSVQADKLVTLTPSQIQFKSTLSGGVGPIMYQWIFGDGSSSTEINPNHLYDIPGEKTVQLTVRDSNGAIAIASVNLVLNESNDSDSDGTPDDTDICPLIVGPLSNRGCPVIATYNGDTPDATATNKYLPGYSLSLVGVNGQCRYNYATNVGAIFGSSTCTSCPCQYTADFLAPIRSCDVIFPSIMSPNQDTIYSRGKVVEVKF